MQVSVPLGEGFYEFVERKSRFIGQSRGVLSVEEARRQVWVLREEHPRSRHVVWAYLIGKDRALMGMSDNGEPKGTAGRPVLDILSGSGITNTLITVVRYFGGIKLGTGGLVSAYGKAAKGAIDDMPTELFVAKTRGRLRVTYSLFEPVKRLLADFSAIVESEIFHELPELEISIPDTMLEEFRRRLSDLSRGTVAFLPDSE